MPFGINLNDVYEQAANLVEQVTDAAEDVASDPVGFASDLGEAVGDGAKQFVRNTASHTVTPAAEWLGNNLEDAGVDMPDEFSMRSMFEVGLDVLGKTKEKLVDKVENTLGEENADVAKAVVSKIIDTVADVARLPRNGEIPNLINKVVDRLADLPEKYDIPNKVEFAKDVIAKVAEAVNPVDVMVGIVETKAQMVDAVLKMLDAMFQSQQRVMDAGMK